MSMFYVFFWNRKKKSFVRKEKLLGVKQNSIDMYVGKNIFKRLVPHSYRIWYKLEEQIQIV